MGSESTPMAVEPTKDQKWGQQAAAIVTKFPQLAQALSAGGMSADPTSLVGHVKHSSTSAEGFDAMMATFEAYITYLTNKESTRARDQEARQPPPHDRPRQVHW